MSIVFENDKGWLLDACSLIDQGHARCISQSKADRQRYFKCRFKQQCFQILKCHFNMNPGNTDLQKTLDNVSKAENETTSRVPSKVKIPSSVVPLSEAESLLINCHTLLLPPMGVCKCE